MKGGGDGGGGWGGLLKESEGLEKGFLNWGVDEGQEERACG